MIDEDKNTDGVGRALDRARRAGRRTVSGHPGLGRLVEGPGHDELCLPRLQCRPRLHRGLHDRAQRAPRAATATGPPTGALAGRFARPISGARTPSPSPACAPSGPHGLRRSLRRRRPAIPSPSVRPTRDLTIVAQTSVAQRCIVILADPWQQQQGLTRSVLMAHFYPGTWST